LWEGGGAALGIPRVRWCCKRGEVGLRRRYGFGVSALPCVAREDGHVMGCRAFCEVSEPPASQRVVGFTAEALVT
jgi:hypothetical protein